MLRGLVALMLVALPAAAAAPGPEGIWRTQKGPKGGSINVRVAPCPGNGSNLCGTIIQTFDMNRPDFIGVVMMRDMVPASEGVWEGELWSPDKDRTYDSRMRMDGAELRVEGCMLSICKSQNWTRVE